MSVRVVRKGIGEFFVESPYNTLFVAAARRMYGRWREGKWFFDQRLQPDVRAVLREIYGTDGDTEPDTVTARVTWQKGAEVVRDGITVGGRLVASAHPSSGDITLGDGVELEAGVFFLGADGRKWSTRVRYGTTVLMREFPRALVGRPRSNAGTPIIEIIATMFTSADVAAALGVSVGWARRLMRAHRSIGRKGRRLLLPAECLKDLGARRS